MASIMSLTILTGSASAAPTEQVYAKSNAPIATEALEKPVVINKASIKPNKKEKCKNWLVNQLHETGFRGKNLRVTNIWFLYPDLQHAFRMDAAA